jgi:Glycosyl transferase family 2
VPAISRISAICGTFPHVAVAARMNPATRCWTETTGRPAEASSASRASVVARSRSRLPGQRNENAKSILTSDWLHGDPHEMIWSPPTRPESVVSPPAISVCILSYNYGRYLRQAVDSALGQKTGGYTLAEIVVIDDGSTDDSPEICASYHDRIRVVPRTHRGFPATLTEAIRQARGDWVALLDADDWFTPDKLEVVATAITPESLLIQHWEHVVKADGSPLTDRPHPGGNTSTLTVRRDAALDLLPVTNELFFHVLDHLGYDVKLTDPLTCYRVHDSNMTDRSTPGTQQDYMQ